MRPRKNMTTSTMLVAQTDIKVDPEPVLVEVRVVDKVMSFFLVDGGSAVNIMSWPLMKKFGLSLSGSSTVNATMTYQHNAQPEGMIKRGQGLHGRWNLQLGFQVLQFGDVNWSYPLLLGQPWFKLKCDNGVDKNKT